jgi:class 3 adenylate cyclase/DNA polymerase III delta prime subunit
VHSCGSCGRANPPDAAFCNGCGQRLGEAATVQPPASPAPPPRQAATAVSGMSFAAGRYRVERLLGEGGKKRVYLAHDTRLGRDVAVSVLKTEGIDESGQVRVRHEAEAMGRLGDHPNVVTVFDIGEEGGQLFIVSEFMAGGDVESRLRDAGGRLETREALRIADQMCRALEHAHGHGIVHRDIKPGNVWLRQDGSTGLGDFGLALFQERSRITQEGMMVGTVAYMPPEQALGRAPDSRSDLYALGATLYEMLTGKPPFVGDDAVAIISQHINTPPVSPSWHSADVPKPLDDLVLRLLAKDPAKRPSDAAEVRAALEGIQKASVATDVPAAPAGNPLDRLASGVFVGREHEVEELRAGVDATLSGQGRILLLVGEPGIGKTRTSEELATYASLRGAQVLWGRCYEGEGAPTYWPWVQLVRSYVRERDPAALLSEMAGGASVIAEVVSEVRERLPGLQPAVALGAEEARFRLFDSLTSFFRNAARQRPLVLLLDDLHWADKPSLLLLQFLARELAGTRILVIGTYRDVELGRRHPLAETLAELAKLHLSKRVLLRGLQQEDVSRFIELSAGSRPSSSLVSAVYRETEGNPFFVHEVVRLLASEGRLDDAKTSGSWSVEIPQGIREAVGRRLNHLSDECNEALTVASVIGREFDLALLGEVVELDGDRLIETLEEALAARVIQEMPEAPGRYRFSHALVRETLHDELNTTRRVRLHRRIGEALEALHADHLDSQLAALAYHFAEGAHAGGDPAKAVEYSTRAGQRATALLAHEDAIPHYERALQMLDLQGGGDDQQRCDVLTALAWAQHFGGEVEKAIEALEQAIPLARKLEDPQRFALIAASFGFAEFARNLGKPHPGAVALLEEALEWLPADADSIHRIQVLHQLGNQLILGDTAPRALACFEEALEVARRVGDPGHLMEASLALIFGLWRPEDLERRSVVAEEVLRFAEQDGQADKVIMARAQRFNHFFVLGDLEACRREQRLSEELISRSQNARAIYWHHLHRASLKLVEGDLVAGEQLAGAALAFGSRVWADVALQMYGAQLAFLRYFQGRLDELLGVLEAGAKQHPQPAWRAGAAWANACLAHREAARTYLDAFAADDYAAMPADGNWPAGISLLASAAHEIDATDLAPRLYELLSPYAEIQIMAGAAASPRGPGHYTLGQLAQTMGRLDDAVRHLERALALCRAWGLQPFQTVGSIKLAEVLLERGAEGDPDRALQLVNQGLDAARDMGSAYFVERALTLKLEVQGIDASHTRRSIYSVARSVQSKRPDFQRHAAADGTVTLMFSDMEGFTAMTERLGDATAHQVIQAHNRILREQVKAHGGREIDSQGDGFLLAFPSPGSGVEAAVAMQRAFASYCAENPEEPIRIRIGLHTGQAIRDADKFFGRTVIMACRIADQARATEILVSDDVRQAIGDAFPLGEARELTLKGFSGTHPAHPLAWA